MMGLEVITWPPLINILVYCIFALSVGMVVLARMTRKLSVRLSMLEESMPSKRGGAPPGFADRARSSLGQDFGYATRLIEAS